MSVAQAVTPSTEAAQAAALRTLELGHTSVVVVYTDQPVEVPVAHA